MTDPYRDGPTMFCLRCEAALVPGDVDALASNQSLVCPRRCGEWLAQAVLAGLGLEAAKVGTTQAVWQQRTAVIACRVCGVQMEARKWGSGWIEACTHGIWIDAGAWRELGIQLALHAESERKIAELARELGSDPGGTRALAIRLLELERRVDRLAAELGLVMSRMDPGS